MQHKRRIKLIMPRLQIKLTLVFMGFSMLALMLQYLLVTSSLTDAALRLPTDSAIMLQELHTVLPRSVVISFLLFMPPIFMIGILTTFRFAGPLHRLQCFMRETIRKENPADCHLRKGDEIELHAFSELLNEVTAPLRKGSKSESATTEAAETPDPVLPGEEQEAAPVGTRAI